MALVGGNVSSACGGLRGKIFIERSKLGQARDDAGELRVEIGKASDSLGRKV